MKLLSRLDEILLLTIWRLKKNAYGVTIRRHISKVTDSDISLGAIYDPLYRLQEKGFVESILCDPTSERGGRSKRMFNLTSSGMDALQEQKKIHRKIWDDIPESTFGRIKLGITGKLTGLFKV